MKLSHSLGQVFLTDKNYVQKILNSLNVKNETVVEIGSGPGVISASIAEKCKFLYCVEFDPRFAVLLEKKFGESRNVKVVHSDILKFDISGLNEKIIVFGNVPYQISNLIVNYLIENRIFIKEAYLTFQKEFVDKVTAAPNSKNFSFLSCYTQYYAFTKKILDVPKGAFTPIPKVDSAFMSLDFSRGFSVRASDEKLLFRIIREAFNQRRKKISNSLSGFISAKNFYSSQGVDPNARAENVSLEQYVAMANGIFKETKSI